MAVRRGVLSAFNHCVDFYKPEETPVGVSMYWMGEVGRRIVELALLQTNFYSRARNFSRYFARASWPRIIFGRTSLCDIFMIKHGFE